MAMSFVVEDGSADPDATSYCAVDTADDWNDINTYQSDAWDALGDSSKQNLLMRASKMLDARFLWNGERVDQDSGLRWPRCGVFDRDGFLIAETVIPDELQQATAEFAAYLMTTDWTAPRDADQYKEVSVDSVDVKYNTDYRRAYIPDTIIQMLTGLGVANSGKKPRFAKIVRS